MDFFGKKHDGSDVVFQHKSGQNNLKPAGKE